MTIGQLDQYNLQVFRYMYGECIHPLTKEMVLQFQGQPMFALSTDLIMAAFEWSRPGGEPCHQTAKAFGLDNVPTETWSQIQLARCLEVIIPGPEADADRYGVTGIHLTKVDDFIYKRDETFAQFLSTPGHYKHVDQKYPLDERAWHGVDRWGSVSSKYDDSDCYPNREYVFAYWAKPATTEKPSLPPPLPAFLSQDDAPKYRPLALDEILARIQPVTQTPNNRKWRFPDNLFEEADAHNSQWLQQMYGRNLRPLTADMISQFRGKQMFTVHLRGHIHVARYNEEPWVVDRMFSTCGDEIFPLFDDNIPAKTWTKEQLVTLIRPLAVSSSVLPSDKRFSSHRVALRSWTEHDRYRRKFTPDDGWQSGFLEGITEWAEDDHDHYELKTDENARWEEKWREIDQKGQIIDLFEAIYVFAEKLD